MVNKPKAGQGFREPHRKCHRIPLCGDDQAHDMPYHKGLNLNAPSPDELYESDSKCFSVSQDDALCCLFPSLPYVLLLYTWISQIDRRRSQDLVAFPSRPASVRRGPLPTPTWSTRPPHAGKVLFKIKGLFTECERAMIREHIHAGLIRNGLLKGGRCHGDDGSGDTRFVTSTILRSKNDMYERSSNKG